MWRGDRDLGCSGRGGGGCCLSFYLFACFLEEEEEEWMVVYIELGRIYVCVTYV